VINILISLVYVITLSIFVFEPSKEYLKFVVLGLGLIPIVVISVALYKIHLAVCDANNAKRDKLQLNNSHVFLHIAFLLIMFTLQIFTMTSENLN
jgi:hypothetical protein